MHRLKNRSLRTRILHGIGLALVLGLVLFLCPTPYQLTAPGPTYAAEALVHVEGRAEQPAPGRFLLLTVLNEPATLLYCVYGLLDPASELARAPRAQSPADLWQMDVSQALSTEVAFDRLLAENPKLRRGLQVFRLAEDSPNRDLLQPGDRLLRLGGQAELDIPRIQRLLAAGARTATIWRAGQERELELRTMNRNGRPFLGLFLRPVLLDGDRVISVTIRSENVSGASGGLVFCLEILRQLGSRELAGVGEHKVAVTGTLDRLGRVGAIEGVKFKRVAAERAGARLMICPAGNREELPEDGSGLRVVGVRTLDEALQALRSP